MNATERARRSDSLYYDTQVTNRRALCDMIAHLESDLAESEAENAKLRELVADMCKALFSLNLDYCQACPREDACVFVHKSFDCDECAFERDMRELGVDA